MSRIYCAPRLPVVVRRLFALMSCGKIYHLHDHTVRRGIFFNLRFVWKTSVLVPPHRVSLQYSGLPLDSSLRKDLLRNGEGSARKLGSVKSRDKHPWELFVFFRPKTRHPGGTEQVETRVPCQRFGSWPIFYCNPRYIHPLPVIRSDRFLARLIGANLSVRCRVAAHRTYMASVVSQPTRSLY
jgi:hypothetical protein